MQRNNHVKIQLNKYDLKLVLAELEVGHGVLTSYTVELVVPQVYVVVHCG